MPCKALRIFPNHKRARGFSLLLNFKKSTLVCIDTDKVIGTWLKRAVPNTVAALLLGNYAESSLHQSCRKEEVALDDFPSQFTNLSSKERFDY